MLAADLVIPLSNLRIFASVAVASGGSLPIIGRALGHSQPQTTARYAHLTDDPVRQLTQTTGQVLGDALRRDRQVYRVGQLSASSIDAISKVQPPAEA